MVEEEVVLVAEKTKEGIKKLLKIALIIGILILIGSFVIHAAAVTYNMVAGTCQQWMLINPDLQKSLNKIGESIGTTIKNIGKVFYCIGNPLDPQCMGNPWEQVEATEYGENIEKRYGVFLSPQYVPTGYLFFDPDRGTGQDWISSIKVEASFPSFPELKKEIRTLKIVATVCNDDRDIPIPGNQSSCIPTNYGSICEICANPTQQGILKYEPKEYKIKKGTFLVNLKIPFNNIKLLGFNLNETYLLQDNVYLSVMYNATAITDYYVLLVKENTYNLAQATGKSIWDFLNLPLEKYLTSRWIGDPGYYIAIGTGSEPIPIVINTTTGQDTHTYLFYAIKKSDPEVQIDCSNNVELYLYLPEYVNISSPEFIRIGRTEFGRWKYNIYKYNGGSLCNLIRYFESEGEVYGGLIELTINSSYYNKLFAGADYADLYIKMELNYTASKTMQLPVKYRNIKMQ